MCPLPSNLTPVTCCTICLKFAGSACIKVVIDFLEARDFLFLVMTPRSVPELTRRFDPGVSGSEPEPETLPVTVETEAGSSASTLQVLRRLGSIFTLVYAADQKLKKAYKVYKARKRLLYFKKNKAISLGMTTSRVGIEVQQLFLKGLYLDFQDSPDDQENTRSSHEYLNDLEEEYKARALLAKSKRFFKKDEEEVSSDENEIVKVKVLMALAEENDAISKEGARNGEWIRISMRKDSADESLVCSTPLPPLKKLDIAEPGNKSSLASKVNSAPAGKLKSVKIKDDHHLAIVIKELNDLKLQISKNQLCGSYDHDTNGHNRIISLEREINPRNPQHAFKRCEACGSSTHTTTDHYDIEWFKKGPKVVFGDDSTCTTESYGSIKCNGIVFTKATFVNGLKYNLISISQLCDAKYIVQFDEKRGTIFNSNKEVVMIPPRVRDVYVLDMTFSAQESCFFAKAFDNINCLWHKRLAHLNFKTINKLAKQNFVILLPSLVYSKDKSCSSCEKGKHHRASFKTKQTSSIKKCLHLLYMDLFGPVTPRSINYEKYTLVIIDEYSRYTLVYFLKKNSQALETIMSFIKRVENQNDTKILTGSRAFRVCQHKKTVNIKVTFHITFNESPDAIKFLKPLVDNINIVENERYPPDEYLYPYVHSQRYQANSNDVSFIEPYECLELVVLETEVSSDLNGQTGQNAQSVQIDEILNDDHSEHSNHTNDKQIIDNLPNTKDV
ncbi:retrovirus-related pol polyprotein from transposon TNT 1-94 [Tanacetum coccineum]